MAQDRREVICDLLRGLLPPEVAEAVDADRRNALGRENAPDLLVEIAPAAIAGIEYRQQIARLAGRQLDERQPLERCVRIVLFERLREQLHHAFVKSGTLRDLDQRGLGNVGHEPFGLGFLRRRDRDPPPAGELGLWPVLETRRGGSRGRAGAQRQPCVELGRETVARGAGDGSGRCLGERGVGEGSAHPRAGQDRRLIVAQPELALQPLAGAFDLGNQIVAVLVVALAEPGEIARQIDFEHCCADAAQSVRRSIQVCMPTGQVGEQEDNLLHLAVWQHQR